MVTSYKLFNLETTIYARTKLSAALRAQHDRLLGALCFMSDSKKIKRILMRNFILVSAITGIVALYAYLNKEEYPLWFYFILFGTGILVISARQIILEVFMSDKNFPIESESSKNSKNEAQQ